MMMTNERKIWEANAIMAHLARAAGSEPLNCGS